MRDVVEGYLDSTNLLSILERISDGVVALDNDWRYIYLNDRAAKMLQRDSPDELIGKHIWTEYPEGVGQPFQRAYVKATETQQSITIEEYYAPWDQWFENRLYPSPDGLTIYFSEVTREKKARIALRRSAAVFSSTKDSVIIADTGCVITSVNPALTAATGYREDELLGQHISMLFADHDRPEDWAAVGESARWEGPMTARRKNETTFPVTASREDLLDEHDKWEGCIVIATDMSELQGRIATEHQLAQSGKMEAIGKLTGGIAHDFNNLLAVIMGNLELLREDIVHGRRNIEDALRLIDASVNATVRGADLTRNMLSFARRARLQPTDLNLNKLVGQTRSWIGRTLPSNIRLETSLLASLWTIRADQTSAQSALLNLILNARDAMPQGGRLTIETRNVDVDESFPQKFGDEVELGHYVMLSVTDTGEGIQPANLELIFEPYFSTKPPGSGSGLGLSMIQGFMKQSGGSVQIHTELGHGTSTRLYFKANPDSEMDPAKGPAGTEGNAMPERHILVAEDEAEVLKVIVATLKKSGYRVTEARSGDEARIIFQTSPDFDLLLTDIVMPGKLQGTDLARELREIAPDLPVVFMSGYANDAPVFGNGLHPDDIRLSKPVRRGDLLAAVETALETASGKEP